MLSANGGYGIPMISGRKIKKEYTGGYIMPRKETITKVAIVDAAFALCLEEGLSEVTARKLAAKAGCSTQPIFRVYKICIEICFPKE